MHVIPFCGYPKIQTHSMHRHKFWKINKKKCTKIKFKLFPILPVTKFLESFSLKNEKIIKHSLVKSVDLIRK